MSPEARRIYVELLGVEGVEDRKTGVITYDVPASVEALHDRTVACLHRVGINGMDTQTMAVVAAMASMPAPPTVDKKAASKRDSA